MFGWIGRKLGGQRIWELEATVDLASERYARLLRDCDNQHRVINIKDHEINTLYGKLATNFQELVEKDEVIARLDTIAREQDAEFQRLYTNRSRPSRDPVTGRYMKRVNTPSLPSPLGWMSDGLRASIRIGSPVTNADIDNAAS